MPCLRITQPSNPILGQKKHFDDIQKWILIITSIMGKFPSNTLVQQKGCQFFEYVAEDKKAKTMLQITFSVATFAIYYSTNRKHQSNLSLHKKLFWHCLECEGLTDDSLNSNSEENPSLAENDFYY